MRITQERYEEAEECSEGYCTECDDFTRDCTEPDADGYDCPACGKQNTVKGSMNALIDGNLEIG